MPDPKQRAQLEAYLSNPGVSEGVKAKIRARLNETAAESPRFSMEAGAEPNDREPDSDVDDAPGPGGSSAGGSPYDELAPRAPERPITGMPNEVQAPAPTSRADDVLNYLRAGAHGLDRSMFDGGITNVVDKLSPGFRASGEAAAKASPMGEAAGVVAGGMMPFSPRMGAVNAGLDNDVLRAGIHGVDRSALLGAGTAAAEMVAPGSRARGEEAAARYPIAKGVGMVGGAMAPVGASAGLAKLVGAPVGAAIRGTGALSGIARGAATGAGSGFLQSMGEDAVAGRVDQESAMRAERAGLVGGMLGGGMAGIGELGRAGGQVVRRAAQGIQKAVSDPDLPLGRDLASARQVGADTHAWRGIEPGPKFAEAQAAARASSLAGKPRSPAGIMEERAVPELGKAVGADIDTRLAAMGGENAQIGDERVSLQPMLTKAMTGLRNMFEDRAPLPGMRSSAEDMLRKVKENVKPGDDGIRIVDIADTSGAIDDALPENVIMADMAAAMGLIPKSGNLENKAVILTPRWVSATGLEGSRRMLDKAGRVSPQNAQVVGEAANARSMGNAAREAREQLGPEAVARATRHEQSMEEMENVINAAGLPRGTRKVNVDDQATSGMLGGAVQRYRTRGNEPANVDAVLDNLAANGPLRGALDDAAGVNAISRLRREAKVPVTPHGMGSYGLWDAGKLRADAVARYLEESVGATARPVGSGRRLPPGLIPAASSRAQDDRRKQR